MKVGIVVFPGSNCDHDCYHVFKHLLKQPTEFIWHKASSLKDYDLVILPGGFSYGDYLRAGAIARFSPIMKEVSSFAKKGGYILGICNGFQMLLEMGLLPGAMMRNRSVRFACKPVYLRVERTDTDFTNQYSSRQVIKVPIAHGEGNYIVDTQTLQRFEDNQQILFRYVTRDGEVTNEANPNGSLNNIAGIINEKGNILGMMPHPERCSEQLLGLEDGLKLFTSVLNVVQ